MTREDTDSVDRIESPLSRMYPWIMVAGVVLAVVGGFQTLNDTGNHSAAFGWWIAALLFVGMAAWGFADE